MPLFRKAIIEEVPPTLYEVTISHLRNVVTTIDSYIPEVDTVESYLPKFVEEYKVYILTALFILISFIICVPLSSLLDSYHKELKSEHHTTLSKMLNVDEEEILELQASSSGSGSSNDDSDSDQDQEDDDISDDGSVEESYEDFLKNLGFPKDRKDGDEVSELQLETPTSSPPTTPSRTKVDDDDRSIRSNMSMRSFKKKLSGSFRSKSMRSRLSFRNKKYAEIKANH